MKYALIGCGRIAPNHIAAALENKLNIVALCDIDLDQTTKLVNGFNLSKEVNIYKNYKEMIESESIDLIGIATESGNHASIALDCIDKGINLIIEKPIALSLKDADLIIEKAKEKNVKVSACHQNRFNKSIQKIREALIQNRFGEMMYGTAHIRWNRGEAYYKAAPWRGTWAQDGGALMNQCIHNIDLLRWMMGDDIIEVIGRIDNKNHPFIEAEDLGLALVRFSNGSYGVIEGTTTVFPKNLEETLYLFGQKGTVKAGGQSVNIIEEWRFEDGLDEPDEVKKTYQENPPNVYGFGHNPYYTDVIDSILNDREPYITAHDGRNAVELVLAIYLSSKENRAVKLPLNDVETVDFKGLFNHE